jgi:B12 binding domain
MPVEVSISKHPAAQGSIGSTVWLADLTHTKQSVASEIMPLAIGMIAAYASAKLTLVHPIRLFKYPDELAKALREEPPPDILGLSHYIWNSQLSLAFARRIKERLPNVLTVLGGPQYPVNSIDQEDYLRHRIGPAADFYVDREAEQPFVSLLLALEASRGETKDIHGSIPGLHSIAPDGRAYLPTPSPKLASLNEIPSPYLTGLMDGFFDGRLIPTIQTTRGCPFSCSFCVEGNHYYSKVANRVTSRTREELFAIGKRMQPLMGQGDARNELMITDSNFGMFSSDADVCDAIMECRETYGWPKYIDVTTGKNRRDRVLATISRTKGAMQLTGSVQSLDTDVLTAIRRKNIDAKQLMDIALAAAEQQTGTYSEVILALPKDSKSAHFATLEKLIGAGFDRLNMFQLTLLPGSDMWTSGQREEYGLVTRFRIIPRCYGKYDLLDGTVSAAEIDEVCVSLPTLSFSDYLDCRQMNLFIAACYNYGTFRGLVNLLRRLDISVFEWLTLMQRLPFGPDLQEVIQDFRAETANQLWESREELLLYSNVNIERYVSGELGNNLLHTYRLRLLTQALDDLSDLTGRAAHTICKSSSKSYDHRTSDFIDEVGEFHRLRLTGLLGQDADRPIYQLSRFDVPRYCLEPGELADYVRPSPALLEHRLVPSQIAARNQYLAQYGATAWGAGRMLTKMPLGDLYRHVRVADESATATHAE